MKTDNIKNVVLAIVCLLMISCCNSTQKEHATKKAEDITSTPDNKSLWTNEQRENFIKVNAKYGIDTLILHQLISDYEFEKNDSVLQAYIQSPEYGKDKKSIAKRVAINIDVIASKNPDEVETILGKPTNKEDINPSGVGTCQKFTYLGGIVEVVYIKNLADWITVNNTPSKSTVKDASAYLSVNQFSDYTYVKVKTK